jgi:hypothetical protein
MKISIADLDWRQLSDRERWTLENITPKIEDGFTVDQIAAELGEPREAIAAAVKQLAARVMALSGRNELPAHTPEEYAALRASIEANGQIFPILKGSAASGLPGEIIDGHARSRICAELRLTPEVRELDGSAEELRALAVVLNVARRHLSTAARRGIITVELLRDPERSDRAIAAAVGVDHKTVASVRRELEAAGEVGNFPTRVGRDGVQQPAAKANEPAPERGERTLRVLVAAELADQLLNRWVKCEGFRLVERRPGLYELQVTLDAKPIGSRDVDAFETACASLAQLLRRQPEEIRDELLACAREIFGRPIPEPQELRQSEYEWAMQRARELGELALEAAA